MSKRDVLLAKHNFSEMKSLANNARIRSSLKFLLIYGISIVPYASAHGVLPHMNAILLHTTKQHY